jgi:hypothetical protein
MTIRAEWHDATKMIMVWTFTGDWTWTDYYTIRGVINEQIRREPHPVSIIVDMRNSSAMPQNPLSHARSAAEHSPDNLAQTVFVGLNPLLRTFFKVFETTYTRLMPKKQMKMALVGTFEEALALIAGQSSGAG